MIAGAPISGHPISGRRCTGRRHPPGGAFHRGAALWARVFVRRLADWRRVFRRERTWNRVWEWRPPTMPTTIPVETLTITTREARYFAFDFSKAPEVVAGETISAPVMHGGTGLTLGSPAVIAVAFDGIPIGKGVRVLVSDADDDTTYDLSCTVTSSGGATLEAPGRLAGVGVA